MVLGVGCASSALAFSSWGGVLILLRFDLLPFLDGPPLEFLDIDDVGRRSCGDVCGLSFGLYRPAVVGAPLRSRGLEVGVVAFEAELFESFSVALVVLSFALGVVVYSFFGPMRIALSHVLQYPLPDLRLAISSGIVGASYTILVVDLLRRPRRSSCLPECIAFCSFLSL